MSLLFFDGFDTIDTPGLKARWNATGPTNDPLNVMAVIHGSGRNGLGVLYHDIMGYVRKDFTTNHATLIFGGAFKNVAGAADPNTLELMWFNDGAVNQFTLAPFTGRALRAYRDGLAGTVLGTSAAGVFPQTGWFYLEVKVVFHASAGSVVVRVNGVEVLSLAGINTSHSGNAYANRLGIGRVNNAAATWGWHTDDIYLCDGAGATNNDFLGDMRVDAGYLGGDGSYNDFTAEGVDLPFHSQVDLTETYETFLRANAVNSKQSFTMDKNTIPVVTGAAVKAVQVSSRVLESSGLKSVAHICKTADGETTGAAKAIGSYITPFCTLFETDPAGNPWNRDTILNAEFGIKVVS